MSIVYDDTDVLLCLLHYFGDLFVSTILVTQRNTMSLRLSGWDQSGKFYGHEKLSCWQAFLPSLSGVIKAFQNLGVDLGNQGKDSMVKDVMDFYCKKRPSTIRNLSELRRLLFLKYQTESIWLPPTMKAFEQAIQRAHFITLQWNHHTLLHQIFLIHVTLGWK